MRGKKLGMLCLISVFLLLLSNSPSHANPDKTNFQSSQFGSTSRDSLNKLIRAKDGLVAVGSTLGSIFQTSFGSSDGWIAKFHLDGSLDWGKQIGTAGRDYLTGVIQNLRGDLFAVGYTSGSFNSEPLTGELDGFITAWSSKGELKWIKRFMNSGSTITNGIIADERNNVLVTGQRCNTWPDCVTFIDKFTFNGDFVNETVLDHSAGESIAISSGSNNHFYVSGMSCTADATCFGELWYLDVNLRKVWQKEFNGLGSTQTIAVTVSNEKDDQVVVGGWTDGAVGATSQGAVDGWLASVSANGKTRWIQQIGTAQTDLITDIVSLDRNTYALIGWTKGALYSASFGGSDAFVTKVNQNGMIVSGLQFGAAENEAGGSGVLLDSNQLIIGGVTSSNLFSLNFGQADVYLKSIFL